MEKENESSRSAALAAMWDTAAALCSARLAAEPNTKELRDLVYIAETLLDMSKIINQAEEKAGCLVIFGDDQAPEWAQ